jgi:hypothetical protein
MLNVLPSKAVIGIGQIYTLFAYSGSFSGAFSSLQGYLIQTGDATAGLNAQGLGAGYSYVNITAVPEPETLAPLGLFACGLLLNTRFFARKRSAKHASA